jgi:hypothetical protein
MMRRTAGFLSRFDLYICTSPENNNKLETLKNKRNCTMFMDKKFTKDRVKTVVCALINIVTGNSRQVKCKVKVKLFPCLIN